MPCFLANLSVFYIVDGLKGDLTICFNVLKLLCKSHSIKSLMNNISFTDTALDSN